MKTKRIKLEDEEEDVVTRCRRIREEFDKRFKTIDEMFDYCAQFNKRRGVKTAKARAARKTRPAANRSKAALRKTANKA